MIPRRVAGIDEGGLARLRRLLYPVEDSERQTVEFSEYDANGNVKKIDFWDSETTGGSHLEWTQVYDDFNRLTERHATFNVPAGMFFGTTDQYFVYDDLGRMVEARGWSNDFPPRGEGSQNDLCLRHCQQEVGGTPASTAERGFQVPFPRHGCQALPQTPQ